MNRTSFLGRFAAIKHRRTKRPSTYRARLESLEVRSLLSANDLLIATFDDSAGASVLRYSEATNLRVPGAVTTGDHGLGNAEGLAVALDGTYYVSSLATGQVLHYSNSGHFLDVLGAADVTKAPLVAPGALAFGPNGNLYVADLGAQAIFQFKLSSATQQYQAAATLPLGYTPGGYTFAVDASHDLIVGSLDTQAVTRYHSDNTTATLIAAGSGINPAAILAQANGNLLIADFDLGSQPSGHHQVVVYNAAAQTTSQFINLTTPVGTGAAAGLPPQPTSLLFDQDGNLLVGLSPDHNGNGAVQKYNIATGAFISTIASGIGTPAGLALVPVPTADLLLATFDDTAGNSVVRYNETTGLLAPGSVATGNHGLGSAEGLALAPDGSYYVSSLATGQVLHYSNSGGFLGVLGAADATQAPLFAPGALAFGPSGNLYVSDLAAKAIFQFDTTSPIQQFQPAATLSLGYTPGGYTFAVDASHDLIVGSLDTQAVTRYHSDNTTATLLAPASGINPAAILAQPNGNLLIADFDLGSQPSGHHQVVVYDAGAKTTTQFINLTTPVGTGSAAGLPPQPTALLYDQDGNLLVGLSPDHNGNGAVQKYNIVTGALIGTVASGVGTPVGLALAPVVASDILVGTFDDSAGASVLRYSKTTGQSAAGGVATGDHGLGQVEGAATAPDGSFYVSSLATGQVLHYSNAGVFIAALGASDIAPAPLFVPGTLAFGPNGNLYVADLVAQSIFQFDPSSATQQYLASSTLALGYTPGGFAFAPDVSHDLIVGSLDTQAVTRYHSNNTTATLVAAASGINPASILARPNGNLLIADLDLGSQPNGHHQVVQYNASTQALSQFINLTTPLGTGTAAGLPSQPTSLLIDQDGNLLVGLSPDHNGNGAVQKYNLATGALIGTIAGGIGTPAGLALVPSLPTTPSANKAPTVDAIGPVTILEDAVQQTVNFTGVGPGQASEFNQIVLISATSSNTALIPDPTVNYTNPATSGSLSFTPVANANGTATITLTLRDNGGVASGGQDTFTRTFTITVTSVNDPPSFVKGADQTLNEDSGSQIVAGWATGISPGPADESGQILAFNVSNDNNALFQVQPVVNSAGTLTYTLAPNAYGSATVAVSLSDNGGVVGGGNDTSAAQTFTITVKPIADTPSVTSTSTNENVQSASGLVISRNSADGAEVGFFKITGIIGGILYQNDGVTPVAEGSFITFAQGNAGLKFTPAVNSLAIGGFAAQASLTSDDTGLGGGTATATITVLPFTPWQNAVNPVDVNKSGTLTPLDAILVINDLNLNGSRVLLPPSAPLTYFPDVSGNNFLSPLDAILVINALNTALGQSVTAQAASASMSKSTTPLAQDAAISPTIVSLAQTKIATPSVATSSATAGFASTSTTVSSAGASASLNVNEPAAIVYQAAAVSAGKSAALSADVWAAVSDDGEFLEGILADLHSGK